ncbi:LysR family transcriptional regulator [Pedobacter sp. SD-b]|uniref:LysR family transcriptional regulator n=1 Tax=Pedobacter segetis TaxID=2793069 RepID=A0ABS1BI14_9SPHI|nr:LysR family transcriptional regulator [Pedobacter segetis]MBK0382522.1 LysR family transcriptional regulator [Pedobacter segetis]
MFDFRLKVFHTVAKRLNFTKAAKELFISQPAVTKHIQELEAGFKLQLFERNGNRINLTPAGDVLLSYTERIFELYRNLEFEMNILAEKHSGILRIGASSTISQYIIPPILADFHHKFKDVKVQLISGNTEQIEKALLHKEIELGIVEGHNKNVQINYQEFLKDELVLTVNAKDETLKKDTLKIEDLKNYPLLIRETGSGTLEVIEHALNKHHIKMDDLNIEMQLGSIESIKSYLAHSSCIAFISIHAIIKELKNNELKIIDIKNFIIKRPFYFIEPQGQINSLATVFKKFALTHNL